MAYNYCYLCGAATVPVRAHDETHWQCRGCAQTFFDNPKPAAEAVLVTSDYRVVIAVRARDPHKGKLDLPGGFVAAGETVEQSLARELTEELGLDPAGYSIPVYLASCVDIYPWGLENQDVVTIPFTARLGDSLDLTAQDDVEKILLLSLEELDASDFAWATQYPLIVAAMEYWKAQDLAGLPIA